MPRQDPAADPASAVSRPLVAPPPTVAAHQATADAPVTIPDAAHRAEGEAWFQKGLSAQSKSQRAQAIEYYQRALAVDPDRPEVLNNLGVLSLEQNHYEEAGDLFMRAIAQSPAYARAHLNLAGALWGLGRRDEALAEARKAAAMDPTAVATHLTLASFLLAMNMKAEASEEARRVLLLEPANAQALVFLNASAAAPAGEPGP
jgi:tetratricopeptide (TPR) repeat protein